MSFKLTYTDSEGTLKERTATPAGNYSIVSTRKDHRYKEELSGEIIFTGDDFDWIMSAGECAYIYITCTFRKIWKGVFSHADANDINISKKLFSVIPIPDDDYSKIEAWMGLPFNIIQPYKGYEAIKDNKFKMPSMFEIERKTVRIDEPYDGDIEPGKIWKGYSVNDWIKGGTQNYTQGNGKNNSLINKITENIDDDYYFIGTSGLTSSTGLFNFPLELTYPNILRWIDVPDGISADEGIPVNLAVSDQDNQRLWLDYSGFKFWNTGGNLVSFVNNYRNNSMWTLVEVINYYSSDEWDSWEYCELIYEREVFRGESPASGMMDKSIVSNSGVEYDFTTNLNDIDMQGSRGWAYNEDESAWYRRPLGAMDCYFQNAHWSNSGSFWRKTEWNYIVSDSRVYGCSSGLEYTDGWTKRSCDGTWFSSLKEITVNGKKMTKQVMNRNVGKYFQIGEDNLTTTNCWYYGSILLSPQSVYPILPLENNNLVHKTTDIVEKFLEFIKDEQTDKEGIEPHAFEFESQMFQDDISPILPEFWQDHEVLENKNPLKNSMVIQNSDLKRPLASEKATKEEHTFKGFLNIVCGLFNCAWAIVDGKFIIEHISYFEQGLSYDNVVPDEMVINPYSIQNVAKNKGFLRLSNKYNYNKKRMPKFEVFKSVGGEEPTYDNVRVEYFGGCVNNLPEENTSEYTVDTTTDVVHTRSEGQDTGITFIFPAVDIINDTYLFIPERDPIFNRYQYNLHFTLENIVKMCHYWGRTRNYAKINGVDWENLTVMKNILQLISLPYIEDAETEKVDNPYAKVITGIGQGIIERVGYNTRTHMLEFQLAFGEVEEYDPPEDPETVLDWYIHEQDSIASETWNIKHNMNTGFIMRPVVFDLSGNEIEYNNFKIVDNNNVLLEFTYPVTGRAHFISMELKEWRRFNFAVTGTGSSSWQVEHNFGVPEELLVLSVVKGVNGFEIKPDEIIFENDNKIIINFTEDVTGDVTIAYIGGMTPNYIETQTEEISSEDESNIGRTTGRVYTKPIVLRAGEEIFYNSYELLTALHNIGFTEDVTAKIIVREKEKT